MAERERLTNKERRARAREERKRKEAEEAAKRKRSQLRNGLVTVVIVAVIGAVLLQAFLGGPDTIDAQLTVSADDAEQARQAAGCEVLADREPLEDRSHFESGNLPAPETIYTGVRPTHSGPHSASVIGIDNYNRQMDEVVSTHNLEHGSVIVWWSPDDADGDEIGSWAETLNASGFMGRQGSGAGIITSPYEDPGLEGDASVAFRAWGTAMDCATWDETVANAFVAENYGTRGIGPERTFAEYPEEVLDFDDGHADDTGSDEAPVDDEQMPADEVEDDDAVDDDAEGDDGDEDAQE